MRTHSPLKLCFALALLAAFIFPSVADASDPRPIALFFGWIIAVPLIFVNLMAMYVYLTTLGKPTVFAICFQVLLSMAWLPVMWLSEWSRSFLFYGALLVFISNLVFLFFLLRKVEKITRK